MTPTNIPDAYYFRHSGPWDREGYGSSFDLNQGRSDVYLNGETTRIDLERSRVSVRMTGDAYYEPSVLMSDGFERGMANPKVTQFSADELDISTGTTVTFWADTGHHSITAMDGPLAMVDEARIDTGRTWSHTFNTPGKYWFEDGFGGGPTGDRSVGILVKVTGPQLYTYLETSTCVASEIETTTVTEEKTSTEATSAPQVQVEAARPKPKVVTPLPRNKDIK
jgi:plastocyanin